MALTKVQAGLVNQLDKANMPAGSVLQVVQTVKTNTFSTTSTTFTPLTGLSVNITPTNSANKILIFVDIGSSSSNSFNAVLTRNGSNINQASSGTNYNSSFFNLVANSTVGAQIAHNYLDSPATTSAVTYAVSVCTDAGSLSVNKRNSDTYFGGTSTITVMEIAA